MTDTRRRRRTRRPPVAAIPRPPLTRAEAHALAGELLRELSPTVGDEQATRAVMLRWLDEHDVAGLGTVCMAAVYLTFAECLTRCAPLDEPPGSLVYDLAGDEPR